MYDFKKYNKKDRSLCLQILKSYNPFSLSHSRLQKSIIIIIFFISTAIALSGGNRRYIHLIKHNLEKHYIECMKQNRQFKINFLAGKQK